MTTPAAEYQRKRRRNAIAYGLCPKCAVRTPARGLKRCEMCLQRQRSKRQAKFSVGLCPECTARPVMDGRLQCETCAEQHRDRRNRRAGLGLCDCGDQRKPGRTRCAECLERHRVYSINRRRSLGIGPRAPRMVAVKKSVIKRNVGPVTPVRPIPAKRTMSARIALIAERVRLARQEAA